MHAIKKVGVMNITHDFCSHLLIKEKIVYNMFMYFMVKILT